MRYRHDVLIETVCFDCDRTERRARFEKNNVLTTYMLTDAAVYGVRREYNRTDPDALLDQVARESEEIRQACKAFESGVWFAGLRPIVRRAAYRGLRAAFKVDDVACDLLVWSCAGRTVFTFQPADESFHVSLITAEDETKPVMGIQGICATKSQAVSLINAATKACADGIGFVRDDKIGMV
jgi:hypothetical protein